MSDFSVTTLTMHRRFSSTPDRVFEAFLNPNLLVKWFMTREFSNKVVKNEPYVGGTWEIVDHRDGVDYRAIGHYLEIDRPRRLVLTFQMPQFSESTDTITVELQSVEDGCEMTFTQEIVVPHEANWTPEDVAKALAEYHSGSEHGWNLMFLGLKEIVEG
ncbi:SRPBCC family protein [Paenibacillus spongiae]|uniref:SRPBCC domain-containing protein n=1 Tax=Paenibacillus spongiae TaxID=2909671 RepID=A0ABY5SIN8_9BACL|nr:SRPBCC domain-containing protein [Paenibacillus spongiae]UVI33509.1 SRPBCC domain-containing protein [Paenibacillus spongiae]